MRTLPTLALPFVLVALIPAAALADNDEISIDACPDIVADAIRSATHGAIIDEIETVTLDGRTLYVVDAERAGSDVNVHVSDSGAVVRIEEDIAHRDAPEAVRAALDAQAGVLDDLDRVTEGDSVRYEAEFDEGAIERTVLFDAQGAVVSVRETT